MSKLLPPLNLTTDMANNELLTNINKIIQFNIIAKNVGSRAMPRFYIELTGPPEVIIAPKKRDIGYLSRGKIRKSPFKVKSKFKGVFSLNAVVKRKQDQLATIPITLKVGADALNLEFEKKIQVEQNIIEKQPENQEITNNCSLCYTKLAIDAKFCQYCGNKID